MNAPTKFYLANPGTMGEESVLKTLFGFQKFSTKVLQGFEVRKQTTPPEHVWEGLKESWVDENGDNHFLAAYTLVPSEGKTTEVGCLEFDSFHELKLVAYKLNFWNFHEKKPNEDKAWFRYQAFRIEDAMYVTEVLNANPDTLEPVEDDYRNKPEYQEFVRRMAEQAEAYRLSIEGSPQGKELK